MAECVRGKYTRVADIGDCHEDLKGILVICFADATFYIAFYFCLALLSMAGAEAFSFECTC